MTVRGILLDLDDTLMPEHAPVEGAYEVACQLAAQKHGIDPAALTETVRTRARELWHACPHRAWCVEMGVASWEGLSGPFDADNPHDAALAAWTPGYRRQAWTESLATFDIQDDALAEVLDCTFAREKRARYTPYPEAIPALESLRGNYRLGMVTNGASSVQRDKAARTGLDAYFETIVVSGEFGRGKPDPGIFLHACQRLGVSAEETVMVGNSLTRDIAGAQAAGIRAVWVNRSGAALEGDLKPHAEIVHVGQLRPLLD